jgi:hypothetical protein
MAGHRGVPEPLKRQSGWGAQIDLLAVEHSLLAFVEKG